MEKLKSIDLFAGIGGVRLGFDQAFGDSVETVFISEWDEKAQQTYRANFPNSVEISGDITQIDEKVIPSFDICLAGFPCQAFSLAGAKKGFNDDYKGMSRGTLFFDVVRICAHHKPKVIFCENVKGLAIHDKGRTFDIIKGTLTEIGYTVHESVLNSKDYGVPQNRERIYIIAFRNDIECSGFEFPQPTDSSKRIKDILEEQPVSAKYYLSDVYVETLRRHRARHEAKGHGFGFEIRGWDEIAGAIVCGGMGRERNLLIDNRQADLTPVTKIKGKVNTEGIRKMTPREWARLQGYPDSFALTVADVHLYKQFGNSVSVPVIKAIAENVKKILVNHEKRRCQQMAIEVNKGEWSEGYAFMRLLADGKLYAADENLNRLDNKFFPIIRILREGHEYHPNISGTNVDIFLNDTKLLTLPMDVFKAAAQDLFLDIGRLPTGKGSFPIPNMETFFNQIYVTTPKAPSSNKADLNVEIHDVQTGYQNVVGFSIKSDLGSPPTLLNPSGATNFTFEVVNLQASDIAAINAIDTRKKIIDRMAAIKDKGGDLQFHMIDHAGFEDILVMIDSQMPVIVAEMLKGFFFRRTKECSHLAEEVANINPLNRRKDFYLHNIKELLCASALGMKPVTEWDGKDEANGGYIIVKTDGDVVAYHIYNREFFKGYLLRETQLDSPSTTRYKYCNLYQEGDRIFIKLNLQIRFM
ncbi:MAG: HpaII family restriction endonuclease [Defluviitaleaceae bacterium]|nr:HpaII family restriction endonuclease [Defluviitaleaceae bacterium]